MPTDLNRNDGVNDVLPGGTPGVKYCCCPDAFRQIKSDKSISNFFIVLFWTKIIKIINCHTLLLPLDMTKSKAGRPGKIQSENALQRISTRISVEAIEILDKQINKALFIDEAIKEKSKGVDKKC